MCPPANKRPRGKSTAWLQQVTTAVHAANLTALRLAIDTRSSRERLRKWPPEAWPWEHAKASISGKGVNSARAHQLATGLARTRGLGQTG
mmetsp:Transcript_82466/g.242024  ORF Transcript_82466/g.242024 Transcript_82466/m.242024 type:complete len:90 (+) Transcript_82466:608-877(+)